MFSRTFVTVLILALASQVAARVKVSNPTRAQVESYFSYVYPVPTQAEWKSLSDDKIIDLFNNLTFYYPDAPLQPSSSRVKSHNYAGTVCDCLHVQLGMCKTFSPTQTCDYWPVTTYFNMDYVMKFKQGFPSNSWFEGLSYPGEWAFPESCVDKSLEQTIYGFSNHVWLYPNTGVGVWWNVGKTTWAYNKVDWLIKFGVGKTANGKFLGNTDLEVMDTLAEISCPSYKTRTTCETCPYAQSGDPTKCCCHGAGQNLGTQIVAVKQRSPSATWDDALRTVAGYYQTGQLGQGSSSYPVGTFFGYRNLLDDYILSLQYSAKIDSVQIIREPQHTGGSGTPSDPGYAFELLFNKKSWAYSWSNLCSSNTLALLNPLEYLDTYTELGYIPDTASILKSGISNFKPTPGFSKLLAKTTTTSTFLANEENLIHIDEVPSAASIRTYAIVGAASVAVVILAAVAFVVTRRIKRDRLAKMYNDLGSTPTENL